MAFPNPFARDTDGVARNITAYKVGTVLSWLLMFIVSVLYTEDAPQDGQWKRRTLFGQSNAHLTPFTPSHVFVGIYWIVLFIIQIGYVWHLFSRNTVLVTSAASVGSHFILFNLLHFAWVMLWTRSHFFWSEVIAVIQFLQLSSAYFRNPKAPRFVHLPVLAMPLSWYFYTVFWNGAVAVHCHGLACRVAANVFVWTFLGFTAFYLAFFKDYHVGFSMAFLMAGLGVGQFFTKVIALQWIFAFVIMGVTFLGAVGVAMPGVVGASEDVERGARERAPLLQDN